MAIDELQSSLLVHEQQICSHVDEEQILKVTYGDQSRGRGAHSTFKGRGRGRGNGRGRRKLDRTTIECYKCHRLGHYQWDFPSKENDQVVNCVEAEEEMLLMADLEL